MQTKNTSINFEHKFAVGDKICFLLNGAMVRDEVLCVMIEPTLHTYIALSDTITNKHNVLYRTKNLGSNIAEHLCVVGSHLVGIEVTDL